MVQFLYYVIIHLSLCPKSCVDLQDNKNKSRYYKLTSYCISTDSIAVCDIHMQTSLGHFNSYLHNGIVRMKVALMEPDPHTSC